jgi:uncharacterized protein YecT (DUF1311 family)
MKKLLPALTLAFSPLCMAEGYIEPSDVHPIEKSLEECLAIEENMTSSGMERCAYQATQEWDKELNKVYKQLMSKLDAQAQDELRKAQRAWVSYKELELNNMSSIYRYSFQNGEGGSFLIPMQAMDELELTKTRALTLSGYLSIL